MRPSILDRLLGDPIGRSTRDPVDALRRDLQDLFNSVKEERCQRIVTPHDPGDVLRAGEEVPRSILCYGLERPVWQSRDAENVFREAIAVAIRNFEPRLTSVDIQPIHREGATAGGRVEFRIEAVLRDGQTFRSVEYRTSVKPSTGEYEVA